MAPFRAADGPPEELDTPQPSSSRCRAPGLGILKPRDAHGLRMARPKRFELLTPRFVVWCSIQLSYGRAAMSPSRRGGGRAANLWKRPAKGKPNSGGPAPAGPEPSQNLPSPHRTVQNRQGAVLAALV